MIKYVAFLRGINVGGRIIKMADLKVCFEKMDLNNVATLLNSGNVVFESDLKAPELKTKIEDGLTNTFNYPAKVWVLSIDEIQKIVDANPFKNAPEDYHQYVIFFENGLEKDFAKETADLEDEKVEAGSGVAYWKVQKGKTLQSSRGKLLAKAKYKNFNTNRNINTLQRILQK
jgi:uncharacterized protein (DUF1697 family)